MLSLALANVSSLLGEDGDVGEVGAAGAAHEVLLVIELVLGLP